MPRRSGPSPGGRQPVQRHAQQPASDSGGQWTRLQEHDDDTSSPRRGARAGGAARVSAGKRAPNTPATPQHRRPSTDEPATQSPSLGFSPSLSIPRPEILKKTTAFLVKHEKRLDSKRVDAEREKSSATIIAALDVARGTSAARFAKYGLWEGAGGAAQTGSPGRSAPADNGLSFRCVSLAAVTWNLETTVKSAILHTFEPEELIEVFELRRTTGGQPRARTSSGWVSVISQNGNRLLKQVEDDRVSARVNGPGHDDGSPRDRRGKSPRLSGGLPRGGPSWESASQLSEGSYRSDDGSALGDTRSAGVRHPSPHQEYSVFGADLEDSVSEADTGEYWSAEEEDLEQELRALEIDETHVAGGARWDAETTAEVAPVGTRNSPVSDVGNGLGMSIPEDNGDAVVEIGNNGEPTSLENPRITEQSMRHNHQFEWEKSLAAYLWRMVNDEMDDDFKVTLTDTRAEPGELPYVEFHVCITVPRILQWIAGRATCELSERCTVVRFFTVFHCFSIILSFLPFLLSLFPSVLPSFCQFVHQCLFAGLGEEGHDCAIADAELAGQVQPFREQCVCMPAERRWRAAGWHRFLQGAAD